VNGSPEPDVDPRAPSVVETAALVVVVVELFAVAVLWRTLERIMSSHQYACPYWGYDLTCFVDKHLVPGWTVVILASAGLVLVWLRSIRADVELRRWVIIVAVALGAVPVFLSAVAVGKAQLNRGRAAAAAPTSVID